MNTARITTIVNMMEMCMWICRMDMIVVAPFSMKFSTAREEHCTA